MKMENIYRSTRKGQASCRWQFITGAKTQRNAEAFLDVVLEYVELLFHFSLRISASPRLCGEKI